MHGAQLEIRPLQPSDRSAAQELAAVELLQSPYGELPASALSTALGGQSAEARGLVSVAGDEVTGLVVFGVVAGAIGTGRLHLVAVSAAARLRGVASALISAAFERLRSEAVRVVFAEVPDDPGFAPGQSLLLREGFIEEARVADFFRDGVSLILLRRDLD
jgi:ribosomal protein S18 acetylase RimI-like enzyme